MACTYVFFSECSEHKAKEVECAKCVILTRPTSGGVGLCQEVSQSRGMETAPLKMGGLRWSAGCDGLSLLLFAVLGEWRG